jgi:thiaminase/transcriptional activator TenA
MSFTDTVTAETETTVETILDHPMVVELGAGTLDEVPFRYWVRQDYVYLVEYCRVLALGAAKAPTLDRMKAFADLLGSTVTTEMDLHRSYAAEFGIDERDLEATDPSPTTRAYTDFLVRTAAQGTFGDVVAAVTPCMWGFNETGKRLQAAGTPEDERYAKWVRQYASAEFTELTERCLDLLDEVATEGTPADRERYRELFVTAVRYEYRFWDAAWREEEWSASDFSHG